MNRIEQIGHSVKERVSSMKDALGRHLLKITSDLVIVGMLNACIPSTVEGKTPTKTPTPTRTPTGIVIKATQTPMPTATAGGEAKNKVENPNLQEAINISNKIFDIVKAEGAGSIRPGEYTLQVSSVSGNLTFIGMGFTLSKDVSGTIWGKTQEAKQKEIAQAKVDALQEIFDKYIYPANSDVVRMLQYAGDLPIDPTKPLILVTIDTAAVPAKSPEPNVKYYAEKIKESGIFSQDWIAFDPANVPNNKNPTRAGYINKGTNTIVIINVADQKGGSSLIGQSNMIMPTNNRPGVTMDMTTPTLDAYISEIRTLFNS
jgi:hypothetical protein